MLELLLCSLLTILPDYLFRRYAQGKRLGKEITLYSVWFELRWGIIACLMLTVGLITVIFYNHPVHDQRHPVLPDRPDPSRNQRPGRRGPCRGVSGEVKQGQPIFRLDSSKQEAAAETARRKIAEVEAALVAAQDRCRGGRGQDPGGQERPPAGRGRTGDEAGDLPAQPGRRRACATSRSSKVAVEGRQGGDRRRHRRKRAGRDAGSPPCSRPRRPAPKPSWPRPRWNWRRPSSGPA